MMKVLVVALASTASIALLACGDDSSSGNDPNVMLPDNTPPLGGMNAPDPMDMNPAGTNAPPPAGTGGDGDGMMGTGVAGCEAVTATTGDLHAAAAAILTPMTPCGFSSCHQGNGKAGLVLTDVADLAAQMVGKPACEAPNLMLVDGSGGDAGLANSYLWQKLTAPAVAGGQLVGDPAWGTPGNCGQEVGSYGGRMPLAGSPDVPGEERLGPIRDWICAGAPGPM